MDLKAKYLLETCSDPIGFLNQLRQTTEPIGGGTVYSEDGELVEYDVAVEAIKKATDAFVEKVCDWLYDNLQTVSEVETPSAHHVESIPALGIITQTEFVDKFKKEIRYLLD